MSRFDRAHDRLLDQLLRSSDLAELPSRVGEEERRAGAGIHAEAELGVAIALRIIYPRRFLEMRSRVDQVALIEACQAEHAAGDARFRHPRLAHRFAHEDFRRLPRKPQLRTKYATDPLPPRGGESLGGIIGFSGEFADAGEG